MGQWLSLPMVAAGVAMLVWSRKAAPGQARKSLRIDDHIANP